jgi:hypothetical protein
LRDEASRLSAPAVFAGDKTAILAVMDQAIAATEAASRGISEYQYSDYHLAYDETPGWLEFEEASDAISDAYARALRITKTTRG